MHFRKFLIFFLIFNIFTVPLFAFDEMNRRIGIIYLKNATANYLNGRYDASERFLKKAGEFYPRSSDFEYINGLIKLEKNSDLVAAEGFFNAAVKTDNWLLLEKKDCIKDLGLILFRGKKYDNVIQLIENHAYPGYDDNDLMYIYLLSLRYSSLMEKYRNNLQRSMNLYPDDYRFAELYLDISISYRNGVLEDMYMYKNKDGALEVYLKAVLSLDESYRKIKLLENYFDRNGRDINAYIEYYRLQGGPDDSGLKKLVELGLFENAENRLKVKAMSPSLDVRNRLDEEWAEYTGNVYYDFNNDKYFEELHLYETGKPAGISIDNNQDSVIDVMLIFQNGLPYEAVINNDRTETITYSEYPLIDEISISDGNTNTVYKILKDALSLNIIEKREYDDKIVYLSQDVENFLDDIENISDNSLQVSVYSGLGREDAVGSLVQQMERRDDKLEILRIYNRLLGNYIYHQSRNERLAGFGDIDFNNLIDLKENYKDGNLVSIEADGDENGIYDYKISFEGESGISWWDFNEDGIYDCRQYEDNGVLIKEYSSNLDGKFDIIERN